MDTAKPSLELLRRLSDQHVLGALIDERALTPAQIAAVTGLSKPTVGQSVRRLVESGAVRDTGERTGGRGRAGTLFALSPDLGVALGVSIAPDGIRAEAVDVRGGVVAETVEELDRPATSRQVSRALAAAARRIAKAAPAPLRLAVVSAADPVDRRTGRLVHLPDAPFLVGELSPAQVLASVVDGPVTVDNDVNWAARAELAAAEGGLDDFAYLYLGEGLGCAVVSDGEVLRGARGLAGEVAHVLTRGPRGHAVAFTEVFASLRLRQAETTAIDVDRILAAIRRGPAGRGAATVDALGEAVAGVLAALLAVSDPEVVMLGGAWGSEPRIVEAVAKAFGAMPRHVPVRPAAVLDQPSLAGVRLEAATRLRTAVVGDPLTA